MTRKPIHLFSHRDHYIPYQPSTQDIPRSLLPLILHLTYCLFTNALVHRSSISHRLLDRPRTLHAPKWCSILPAGLTSHIAHHQTLRAAPPRWNGLRNTIVAINHSRCLRGRVCHGNMRTRWVDHTPLQCVLLMIPKAILSSSMARSFTSPSITTVPTPALHTLST